MKRTIFLTVASILMLASCTTDENAAVSTEGALQEAISFGTYVNGAQSRGSLADTDTLKEKSFYVFANVIDPSVSKTETLMESQQIKWVTDKWAYTPVKYWPTEKNKTVDFYAIGPKDDNTTTDYDWNNLPQTSFSVNEDVSQQTDFLWAAPILGKKRSDFSGPVTFNFQHALTAYAFTLNTAQVYDDISKLTINSITISGNFAPKASIKTREEDINKVWSYKGDWGTRSYTISTAEGNIDPDVNFNSTTAQFVVKDDKTAGSTPETSVITNNNCDYIMLLPYKADMTYTIELEYTITTKDLEGNDVDETYKVKKDVAVTENKPGKLIVNNITLSLTAIEVSASVTEWNTNNVYYNIDGTDTSANPSSFALNKSATTITAFQNEPLSVISYINGALATPDVTWSSDADGVAYVDENGKVYGLSSGTATITAKTNEAGGMSASCTVTVAPAPFLLAPEYSVSATKKVQFTRTNLYWNGTGLAFENAPTEYPQSYSTSHIGHFRFANTLYDSYGTHNYVTSPNFPQCSYLWCNESHKQEVGGYSGLYALSQSEWNYLLKSRSGSRFAHCNFRGKYGLLIFPDGYSGTTTGPGIATVDKVEEAFPTQSISVEKWCQLNNDGVVYLPTSGRRDPNSTSYRHFNLRVEYWTSSKRNGYPYDSYEMWIAWDWLETAGEAHSDYGFALRLVK